MRDFEFFLEKLSKLGRAEITCCAYGQFWDLHPSLHPNPVRLNTALREKLIGMTLNAPHLPAVIRDEHDVLYAAIVWEDAPMPDIPDSENLGDSPWPVNWNWFFIGPVALHVMSTAELLRYYRHYNIGKDSRQHPPVLSFSRAIAMIQIAAMILGKRTDEEEIIRINDLDVGKVRELDLEQIRFSWAQEEEEAAHHTYIEEQYLLDCIRRGEAQEAIHQSHRLDQEMGAMSSDSLQQWKKTLIVSVTLSTRAAIEGGLSPKDAYSLSDFYLQKCDEIDDPTALIALRDASLKDFCSRIKETNEKQGYSPLVRRVCDYIHLHYREKIYLSEIAKMLKISESHLSRAFHQETGVTLQEYVVKVRIERASNLLRYSEESISAIGDYVGFPSQSYFGAVFRKFTGLTPRAFREANRR